MIYNALKNFFSKWKNHFIPREKQQSSSQLLEINLLKNIFWHLPHVFFVRDRNGKFLLANKHMASDWGDGTMDAIIGKTDADFIPNEEVVQRIQNQDKSIMDSKIPVITPKTKYPQKNGSVTWLQNYKIPIIDKNGECNHVLGFSIDVTEKVQIEEKIRDATDRLSNVVVEVTQKMIDLLTTTNSVAEITTQQADQLHEVTNTSSKIDLLNNQILTLLSQTLQIVLKTTIIATEGDNYIHIMNESMKKIDSSSQKMVGIIEIIDEIADQTNLLSLNASIESARAGNSGLGFAVVAKEISKLAEKSSKSTKDIQSLIKFTTSEIKTGNHNISEGSKTFKDIISQVQIIDSIIREIDSNMKNLDNVYQSFGKKVNEVDKKSTEIKNISNNQMEMVTVIMKTIVDLNKEFQDMLSLKSENEPPLNK